MNTRELIEKIQVEVITGDITPSRAGELVAQLSSLLGNVNVALNSLQMVYNKKLAEILKEQKTVTKAHIIAETTKEYEQLLDLKGIREMVMEMIRSMKILVKIKLEEYREAKY